MVDAIGGRTEPLCHSQECGPTVLVASKTPPQYDEAIISQLIHTNDISVVAVCRGDEESALAILQEGKDLLAASSLDRSGSRRDKTEFACMTSPMALSLSIKQYSKIHRDKDGIAVDANEKAFQLSPGNSFQLFDQMFAVALTKCSAIPSFYYDLMYQLLACVLEYNTGLVYHRMAIMRNQRDNMKLAEDHYFNAVHAIRRLYSTPEIRLCLSYTATTHTLHLLLLATFNNLGHMCSQIGCKQAASYHERMQVVFWQTNLQVLTPEEYLFFFMSLSMPPVNLVATAA